MDKRYKISNIKVSIVKTQSAGADYTDHAAGHWINDTIIANPMSVYSSFQDSRSSWGMDVLKGIFIEKPISPELSEHATKRTKTLSL